MQMSGAFCLGHYVLKFCVSLRGMAGDAFGRPSVCVDAKIVRGPSTPVARRHCGVGCVRRGDNALVPALNVAFRCWRRGRLCCWSGAEGLCRGGVYVGNYASL